MSRDVDQGFVLLKSLSADISPRYDKLTDDC